LSNFLNEDHIQHRVKNVIHLLLAFDYQAMIIILMYYESLLNFSLQDQ